jgi:hypothetical protein
MVPSEAAAKRKLDHYRTVGRPGDLPHGQGLVARPANRTLQHQPTVHNPFLQHFRKQSKPDLGGVLASD